jgi:hypothetical protein
MGEDIYRKPETRFQVDHPFILALKPTYTEKTLKKKLEKKIDYNLNDRLEPDQLRITDYLNQLHFWSYPTNNQIYLYQQLRASVVQGYRRRPNPTSPEYKKLLNFLNRIGATEELPQDIKQQVYRQPKSCTSLSFPIMGHSGTGKTISAENVCELLGEAVYHTVFNGHKIFRRQVPYMILRCPPDGSLLELVRDFYETLDAIADTNWCQVFDIYNTASPLVLARPMKHLAIIHGLGALIIDELQELVEARTNDVWTLINFFFALTSMCLPVIPISTWRVLQLFLPQLRNARRVTGEGTILFDRMKEENENGSINTEWENFTNALWKYQYVRNESPLTDEARHALYESSIGIHDIVVKVFILAQKRAIAAKTETITSAEIYSIRDQLPLIQPMLAALESGDPSARGKFEDLHDEYIRAVETYQFMREIIKVQPQTPSVTESDVDNSRPNDPKTNGIEEEAPKPTISPKTKSSKKSKARKHNTGLLELYVQAKAKNQTAYAVLYEAGYIRDFLEIFPPN